MYSFNRDTNGVRSIYFTEEEIASWEQKMEEAEKPRPGDEYDRYDRNKSASRRVSTFSSRWRREFLRRFANDPERAAELLIVALHEKTRTMLSETALEDSWAERVKKADTAKHRRQAWEMLEAFKKIPRSWATSALTRFFRGNGKQGKGKWLQITGSGILGKDYGWKNREATSVVEMFYYGDLGAVLTEDLSPDCYGEEAGEVAEEGGNPFAATTIEKDLDFAEAIQEVLEERGLGDDLEPLPSKKPKRTPKTFEPGDSITSRNVRDLPEGSHFRFTLHERNQDYSDRKTKIHTFEAVYVRRDRPGHYVLKPVMKGKVFAPVEDCTHHCFEEAEYIGPFEDSSLEALDIEIRKWEGVKKARSEDGWTDRAMRRYRKEHLLPQVRT